MEELWRRAEEIRSLCGLPQFQKLEGPERERDARSLEALVGLLLADLEANFRRGLATRVQLEGLGELMGFAIRDADPDRPYHLLLQYLSRALDEPRLWLGRMRGHPSEFCLHRPASPSNAGTTERVPAAELNPEWLRWVSLGEVETAMRSDPRGRRGGPWHALVIRGDMPADRLSGGLHPCPGATPEGGACAITGARLEDLAGGQRQCGRCEFRRVVGLVGVEGESDWARRGSLEAIVPSLGAVLVNLALNEALDLEARFREDVIENMPLGVVAVDREGQVLAWNRSAEDISGTPRAAALARRIDEIAGAEGWHGSLLRSLKRGGVEAPSEHIVRRQDGVSIPIEVNAAALRDAEGRIRGAVATLTDLSNLRTMEERIRQLDRLAALGRFASSVAHEIRNPLTGIATGVQYLSRGFPEGDERHEDVTFILREVSRLNSIIQDLLSATRPRMLTLGPVSVADAAGRAIQSLGPTIEEGRVQIRLEGADHWPKVLADTDQLQQVFLNLVQNAVQAIPNQGEVAIRARPVGNPPLSRVEIEIADTGVGIEPDHLPHLFEPFYTTRPKGTGLGLFVAHGIVQRHGGSIEVVSAPGQGTRFRILLPAAA